MKNHSLRVKIINRNKEVTSLRDYAVTWNFSLKILSPKSLSMVTMEQGVFSRVLQLPSATDTGCVLHNFAREDKFD
jgi:hypothetical protein